MTDRGEVVKGLEKVWDAFNYMEHELYADYVFDALVLLKEQEAERSDWISVYEKGFNDAMHGKQELMYEGTDGKWHKKDW